MSDEETNDKPTSTVASLIELLQTLPSDMLVILSKDAEGNGYSPWADYCTGKYEAESTWSGDFHSDPEEISDSAVDAVVLWPAN